MNFQTLFAELDLSKAKIVRHNSSRDDVAKNYYRGADYFNAYQSRQRPGRFGKSKYVISFLGTESTNGIYLGTYRIIDCVPYDRSLVPEDYTQTDAEIEGEVFYRMQKTDILAELENRLVIDWGRSTLSWCQNATIPKEVLCILPSASEIVFSSYDKVVLSYEKLKKIVQNEKTYSEWKMKLSSVTGIYLITDVKTGMHYVGSASGEVEGIWGRWTEYIKTRHGGNKQMMRLMERDPEYCYNFQFSILDVFPIKRDKKDILECERLYKRKLRSVEFGLNDN